MSQFVNKDHHANQDQQPPNVLKYEKYAHCFCYLRLYGRALPNTFARGGPRFLIDFEHLGNGRRRPPGHARQRLFDHFSNAGKRDPLV